MRNAFFIDVAAGAFVVDVRGKVRETPRNSSL
jgi:hypothetical protein